jgi:hypothetical protein
MLMTAWTRKGDKMSATSMWGREMIFGYLIAHKDYEHIDLMSTSINSIPQIPELPAMQSDRDSS